MKRHPAKKPTQLQLAEKRLIETIHIWNSAKKTGCMDPYWHNVLEDSIDNYVHAFRAHKNTPKPKKRSERK